MVGTILLGL